MTKSNQICECGHIEGIHGGGVCLRHHCPCTRFVAKEIPEVTEQ